MYGVSHQYETNVATTYEVRFSGVLTSLDLVADVREARENTLLSIKQWGYTGLTRIMLSGFSSLKSIAADTEGAFRGMEHFGVELMAVVLPVRLSSPFPMISLNMR